MMMFNTQYFPESEFSDLTARDGEKSLHTLDEFVFFVSLYSCKRSSFFFTLCDCLRKRHLGCKDAKAGLTPREVLETRGTLH